MSGDLLGVGISGLLASQRGLSTTSHNVANVNTEGYSRQSVELATRDPQYTGGGFIGRGVEVANIRRIHDQFLTTEIRDATASVNEFSEFFKLASQVDNLVADPQGSLSPALQGFFDAVQDLSNAPASIPARQALLTSAETMVDRFRFFNQRLDEYYSNAGTQLDQLVTQVNNIATAIAGVNRSIVDVNGSNSNGSQEANDLLDRRDTLLAKLSELVAVKTVDQGDGTVNVFIGSGQVLVSGYQAQTMALTVSEFDINRMEVGVQVGANVVEISDQIRGGKLAGVLDYRERMLDTTKSALGRIALGLTSDFNAQHRLGIDLTGQLGEDFFSIGGMSAPGTAALASSRNTTTTGVSFVVTDTSALTTSDYRLTYIGSNQYTLTRASDGNVTTIDTGGTYPYTSAEIDGFTLTIAAAPTLRDTFLVRPTFDAMGTFDLTLTDASRIAAASPVRTVNSTNNTGSGHVNAGEVVDRAAYVSGSYNVTMAAATGAATGGTIGTITDNNADSTLQYELAINGVTIYTQTEAAAALATPAALAAAINGASDANVALTGVKAYVDTTSNTLYLVNSPSSSLPIQVSETLTTSAGTVEDGDTVTGYFGSALTGSTTPSATINYARTADSYVVIDSSDAVVTADTYTDGGTIAFNGIEVAVTGDPNLGDVFTVDPNLGGIGDNRNALALAALQTTGTLESSTATYQDAYGQLIATVGTRTNQANLNFTAQDALLNHAQAARADVAGVNLDEEAANLLKFQQTYQASAQVIAAADRLFETLIGIMGR